MAQDWVQPLRKLGFSGCKTIFKRLFYVVKRKNMKTAGSRQLKVTFQVKVYGTLLLQRMLAT
jgi:hypothetical protein